MSRQRGKTKKGKPPALLDLSRRTDFDTPSEEVPIASLTTRSSLRWKDRGNRESRAPGTQVSIDQVSPDFGELVLDEASRTQSSDAPSAERTLSASIPQACESCLPGPEFGALSINTIANVSPSPRLHLPTVSVLIPTIAASGHVLPYPSVTPPTPVIPQPLRTRAPLSIPPGAGSATGTDANLTAQSLTFLSQSDSARSSPTAGPAPSMRTGYALDHDDNSPTIRLTLPVGSFHIPKTNIEAIFRHTTPSDYFSLPEEVPRLSTRTFRRTPRESLPPNVCESQSRSSVDKQDLLASIMWRDDVLRDGLTISVDTGMLKGITNAVLDQTQSHDAPDFLVPWIIHLFAQNSVHAKEEFTNEPDATGASRAHIFHLANIFHCYRANFVQQAGPSVKFIGPSTQVVAICDVSGRRRGRVLVSVENKRPRVCTDTDIAQLPPEDRPIRILVRTENDRPSLVWENCPQDLRVFVAQVGLPGCKWAFC